MLGASRMRAVVSFLGLAFVVSASSGAAAQNEDCDDPHACLCKKEGFGAYEVTFVALGLDPAQPSIRTSTVRIDAVHVWEAAPASIRPVGALIRGPRVQDRVAPEDRALVPFDLNGVITEPDGGGVSNLVVQPAGNPAYCQATGGRIGLSLDDVAMLRRGGNCLQTRYTLGFDDPECDEGLVGCSDGPPSGAPKARWLFFTMIACWLARSAGGRRRAPLNPDLR